MRASFSEHVITKLRHGLLLQLSAPSDSCFWVPDINTLTYLFTFSLTYLLCKRNRQLPSVILRAVRGYAYSFWNGLSYPLFKLSEKQKKTLKPTTVIRIVLVVFDGSLVFGTMI